MREREKGRGRDGGTERVHKQPLVSMRLQLTALIHPCHQVKPKLHREPELCTERCGQKESAKSWPSKASI